MHCACMAEPRPKCLAAAALFGVDSLKILLLSISARMYLVHSPCPSCLPYCCLLSLLNFHCTARTSCLYMHLLLDPSGCNYSLVATWHSCSTAASNRALEISSSGNAKSSRRVARCQPVCVGTLHGQELSFLTAAVASSVGRRSPSHQAGLSACALVRGNHPSHPSARTMQRASVASTRVSGSSAGLQRCECRGQNSAQHTHPAHSSRTQHPACMCMHPRSGLLLRCPHAMLGLQHAVLPSLSPSHAAL